MLLDLGCGDYVRTGYVGVDMVKSKGVKYKAKLGTKEMPLAACTAEGISTSHFLEHLNDQEALFLLEDSFRVLKPGSLLEIVVPDFPRLIEMFQAATPDLKWGWWIKTVYGDQSGPGQYHKSGWDFDKLGSYLEKVGFVEIRGEAVWTHDQPSLRVEARKPYEKVVGPAN